MASLLDGTGLVHDYYLFPPPSKDAGRVRQMLDLAREIRTWKPEILIYLHEPRGQVVALRDAAIFRMLGIRRLIGVPLTRSLQRTIFNEEMDRVEHRSEYLARALKPLGDSRLDDRASWQLGLTSAERTRAQTELQPLGDCAGIIAMSIGAKIDVKDWGDDNWRPLLNNLSTLLPHWGMVALGAPVEHRRSSDLLSAWRGPHVNLCGKLSVRESAAVMECARIFVGHDSGPMHLAAAVGTPCAAIFSARNLRGHWFPYGRGHTVFYKQIECAGCGLEVCVEFKKKCISSISVAEVSDSVISMLSAHD